MLAFSFYIMLESKKLFLTGKIIADKHICCRADTNMYALRLRRRALIFRDLPSNNMC